MDKTICSPCHGDFPYSEECDSYTCDRETFLLSCTCLTVRLPSSSVTIFNLSVLLLYLLQTVMFTWLLLFPLLPAYGISRSQPQYACLCVWSHLQFQKEIMWCQWCLCLCCCFEPPLLHYLPCLAWLLHNRNLIW